MEATILNYFRFIFSLYGVSPSVTEKNKVRKNYNIGSLQECRRCPLLPESPTSSSLLESSCVPGAFQR